MTETKAHARNRALLVGLALLLSFWITRVIALDAFPPFVDESFHIGFAERIAATGGVLAHADEGRVFTIWWYLLFQPYASGAIWLARVVTVLAVLPGFAAIVATGRLAAGLWGGLLVGLLTLFSTYHMFFERLALADPVSSAAVSVGLYCAYRLSRRLDYRDALLAGLALFVAFGAKVSALPYLGIPLAAVLTLGPRAYGWRQRGLWAAVALIPDLALTLALIGVTALRGYDIFFYLRHPRTGDSSLLLLDRIQANIATMRDIMLAYLGPIVLGALAAAVLLLIIRRRFYLPLVLLAPSAVFWMSSRENSRHLIIPITILLLCGAVALALVVRRRNRRVQMVVMGVVLLWGLVTWLPFAWTAARSPVDLPLAAVDRAEYITADASGFGLAEVAAFLEPLAPQRVIGILPNCSSLRYMTLRTLPVECPHLNPTGEDIPALQALLAESRSRGTYAVLEDSAYAPDRAPGELLLTVDHPSGRPRLRIYDLAP